MYPLYRHLKLRQAGIAKKVEKKWKINPRVQGGPFTPCVETSGSKNAINAFGKEEVVSLFTLLTFGLSTALSILAMERLVNRERKQAIKTRPIFNNPHGRNDITLSDL